MKHIIYRENIICLCDDEKESLLKQINVLLSDTCVCWRLGEVKIQTYRKTSSSSRLQRFKRKKKNPQLYLYFLEQFCHVQGCRLVWFFCRKWVLLKARL